MRHEDAVLLAQGAIGDVYRAYGETVAHVRKAFSH
jgi:hypothetical protein